MVCVASYQDASEGELARLQLAMHGIPAFLENANLVLWAWYYSFAVGGVKVFAPETEAQRAWNILHPSEEVKKSNRRILESIKCEKQDASATPEESPVQDEYDADIDGTAREEIETTVFRAWNSAVFGIYFVPLAFYSLWILIRYFCFSARAAESFPRLRPCDTLRVIGTIAISIAIIFTSFMWMFLLL